jgi:site-specific recombinase XerD
MTTIAHKEALQQIKDYEEHLMELGRTRNTVKAYINDLTLFAEYSRIPFWPEPANLEHLTLKWLEQRSSMGDSVATIRRRVYALKSYYTFAGLPAVLGKVNLHKNTWYIPTILSYKQVKELLTHMKRINPEVELFYRLMFLTGLRFNELYNIKITEEELNRKLVYVMEESGAPRAVVLGSTTCELLESFVKLNQWKTRKNVISRTLEVCGMLTGIKKLNNQIVRSTACAFMLANGLKPAFVRSNMGYKSYATLNLIMKLNAMELLGTSEDDDF